MNKPLTITVKETQMKLAKICNESGLPLVVLDLIIQGVYSEIHSIVEKQFIEEEKVYIESLKEKKEETKKE